MSLDNQDQRPNSPRRLPWPAVALGTTAFLLLLLTAAVWSDRTLRPRPGPEPTPAPTQLPMAAATPTPAPKPTPTPQPVAAAPTPVAWWNWRNEVPPDLRDEIWSAYLTYWQVIADAHRTLDSSEVSTVASGQALERAILAVKDLESAGTAQELRIDHNAKVLYATDIEAVLYDEYISRSVFIEPSTGLERPSTDPPLVQQISFRMQNEDGSWKVNDAVRHN
jgi:hypothetical protein